MVDRTRDCDSQLSYFQSQKEIGQGSLVMKEALDKLQKLNQSTNVEQKQKQAINK